MVNRFFLPILFVPFFCSNSSVAQNLGNIAISVVASEHIVNLDASQGLRLNNKVMNLVVQSGLSATKRSTGVILYPKFSIVSEDVIESGMKNLIVVNADISFIISQVETGVVFATINREVRGSGINRQKAIDDAITKISIRDKDFANLVYQARIKIYEYNNSNCSNTLLKAKTCSNNKDFEQAFALLASIPDVATCYSEALKLSESVYYEYMIQSCNELLLKAETLYASHKYIEAMELLYDMKHFPSICIDEVRKLMILTESKLTEEEMRQWDYLLKDTEFKNYIQIKRLEVIQAIAEAYYERKIINNDYVIIK